MRRGPLVVGVVVALASAAGFWELAEDFAYSPAVMHFDTIVSGVIQSWRTPWLNAVMTGVTLTGGFAFVLATTTVVALALWLRLWRGRAIIFTTLVAVGALLSTIAKGQFGRPRPPAAEALVALPVSYSFPSGHSMASLCLGTALAYLALRSGLRPVAKALAVSGCAVYAVAVGVSRVYLGVHWPSDVLASWLLGATWLASAIGAAEAWRPVSEPAATSE